MSVCCQTVCVPAGTITHRLEHKTLGMRSALYLRLLVTAKCGLTKEELAIVRLAEEALPDKLVEQQFARRHIYLPQPTRLRERHSQPRHLEVFTPNASDKGFKRRRIASADSADTITGCHVCEPFAQRAPTGASTPR